MTAGGKDRRKDRDDPGGKGPSGGFLHGPGPGQSELDFHYSRDARLSLPTAPRRPPRQSFFRRHRGLLIILADIAILVILGFVFLFFFGPPDSTAKIGGYRVTLRALRYGEAVFATVSVRGEGGAREGQADGSGGAVDSSRVFVRFALSRNAPDSESFFDSAPLPGEPQSEVVMRAALPFRDEPSRLYAEVRIGQGSALLSLPKTAW